MASRAEHRRRTRFRPAMAYAVLVLNGATLPPIHTANIHSPEWDLKAFYHWYIPHAIAGGTGPAWLSVVQQRPPVLSSALRQELAADLRRSDQAVGEIDGIDFDPFLGAQDPCSRVVLGRTVRERQRYVIKVTPLCAPGTKSSPFKVFMLRVGLRFVIDDVDYGERYSLRRALEAFRPSRRGFGSETGA